MTPKLKTLPQALAFLKRERKKGKKIVFTNGCFDILHVGHVRYLSQARALGDLLVVGLNKDSSVKKIKGPKRPVTREKDRAEVLGALAAVDCMVLFGDPTPLRLIKAIRPDVLVKGGDWKKENIVGAGVVEALGGQVRSLPFVKGFSTTGLIGKIKKAL
jgi:D-beta-D-heptose 7-phosphate kinase/D-beta-D-heptose 1-phosphate adenosyltransferase